MSITVADYLVKRLSSLGINHVFGVPGDYAFPIDDAIENCPDLEWVLSANELNASYAADGYARIRGASILTTTYGVGELCAIGGLMGAKAHRVPVFHLVGMPSLRIQKQGLITHHTLGDGIFGNFIPISTSVACVWAQLTSENAVEEIERVIREALRQSAPAYIIVPEDQARMPILGQPVNGLYISQIKRQKSQPKELEAAVTALADAINNSKNPVVFPTTLLQRYGIAGDVEQMLKNTNLPFAILMMDKGVISEELPGFLGLYAGYKTKHSDLRLAVESADVMLDLGGVVLNDFNSGFWTTNFPKSQLIVTDNQVKIGADVYVNVAIDDVVRELTKRLTVRKPIIKPIAETVDPVAAPDSKITSEILFSRLQKIIRGTDTLITETGSCMGRMAQLSLPTGAGYQGQLLWGSIGWATPAALGIAIADKKKRVILMTGDGSHQLTANEIGVMGRYEITPLIFLLNNGIYGIEDVLSEVGHVYDDLAPWNYSMIPEAMGCKNWLTVKVSTVAELDAVITKVNTHTGAAFIEVMIPPEESQPVPMSDQDYLYKLKTPFTNK